MPPHQDPPSPATEVVTDDQGHELAVILHAGNLCRVWRQDPQAQDGRRRYVLLGSYPSLELARHAAAGPGRR